MPECQKCERDHEFVSRVEWGWALRESGIKPTVRGVLAALADHMDPGTGCGWISLQTLASELRTSRDTVMRAVKHGKEAGVVFQATRGHGAGYRSESARASEWELRIPLELSSKNADAAKLSRTDATKHPKLSSKNADAKSQKGPMLSSTGATPGITCTRRDLEQAKDKDIPPLASLVGAIDGCETHGTPLCDGHCHACWDDELARNRADVEAAYAARPGCVDLCFHEGCDHPDIDDEYEDDIPLGDDPGAVAQNRDDMAAAIRTWPALRRSEHAAMAKLAAMILNLSTDKSVFTLAELAASMGYDVTEDDARAAVKELAGCGLLGHLNDCWEPYGRALPAVTDPGGPGWLPEQSGPQ